MLPWFKFTHVEYLLDPVITGLSLIAQGANTRLMAYAALQSPFATLPNDFEQLAVMCGVKIKQWEKLSKELMGKVWFVGEDGRLFCPMMIVESAPVAQSPKQDDSQQDDSKPLSNAERCKRYRDSKKNVGDTNTDTSSDTQNMSSDTTATRTQHDSDTTKSVDSVSFGGIKGGDLDLDLDLKQELNSHSKTREAEKNSRRFFDDELRPDLNLLNAKLGANLVTQKFIDENLFLFNSHYETHQLTDNQRLAKWIAWWKGEQAKQQAQTIQRPPKNTKPIFGNVNDSFPINPNDRLLTQEERAAIAKSLEEDEHVVF